MTIKVTCEVPNYDNPIKPRMLVHNHWNYDNLVVIEVNGERFTVNADDLKAAIDNCVNVNRFS